MRFCSPVGLRTCHARARLLPLLVYGLCHSGGLSVWAQDSVSPVVVARVIEAQINAGRRVVGTVMPLRSSTIGSAVDGRVVEFLIDHGDPVKKTEPLAKLRSGTLEIELAAAKAELRLSEQQLAEVENGSRPEDINEARAKMLGAKAAMENAATKLQRLETLSPTHAISETELGDARERAEFARHVLAAAQALLERAEQGPRIEQIYQAQAQVELQRQRVRLIEDRITKHTIVAPFDGFVAAEFTEVGAWIKQGDPVAEIIQLDEVEIQSPVPAEYAVQLRRGDTVRVEFPELPDQLFTGTIERVVPMAETRTRTFPVYVRLKNHVRDGEPLLMAGMLARVELPAGQRQIMPLVPKDALVLNGTERSVFVVEMDVDPSRSSDESHTVYKANANHAGANHAGPNHTGTVRKLAIDLGVAAGGFIQIRSEIRPGQLVVVVGNERLRDGDRVTVMRLLEEGKPALESGFNAAAVDRGL